MRTTLAISDELLVAAKQRAGERGMTLGSLVESALRRELAVRDTDGPRLPVPVFRGGSGPRAGLDLTSNRSMIEALDEGLELDSRR